MSKLTRDGTAETVSRDQILRRERGQGTFFFIFPVKLTTTCRMSNLTRLIHTLAICVTIHSVRDKPTVILCVVCVCVFFPFILDIKFVGRTSRGHTGGRSHRISHPPSFCGACLNFSREKDSAFPFPRRVKSNFVY